MTAPAMLKSARSPPIEVTPNTAKEAARQAPSSAQGTQRARRPAVRPVEPEEAVIVVMSVRSGELGAARDDPARQGVDREGHDEQDQTGRDQRVDTGVVRLGEGERD